MVSSTDQPKAVSTPSTATCTVLATGLAIGRVYRRELANLDLMCFHPVMCRDEPPEGMGDAVAEGLPGF